MRTRAALYGTAIALLLAGVLCAILIAGRTGEALTIVGGSFGGIGLISLLFLEVGLSEDRERRREAERAGGSAPRAQREGRLRRAPRRPRR